MSDFDDFTVVDADYLRRFHLNDAAIAALRSAEVEGIRLGANTLDSQLVLVGLMADDSNLAVKTVLHLGETPERIRAAALASFQGTQPSGESRTAFPAKLFVAEEVRDLCRLAVDEAARLGSVNSVGAEHLLLATVRADEYGSARLLKQAGMTLERTRRALRIVLGRPF